MKRVLIIEDDATLHEAYKTVLTQEGFDVSVAVNGLDGLAKAKSEKPHVILLDMIMPNMNGVQFLKLYLGKAKIIVFSNIGSQDYVEETARLGAVKYLTKSNYTPKEIVKIIKELI